jgi:hypothetical protein
MFFYNILPLLSVNNELLFQIPLIISVFYRNFATKEGCARKTTTL